MNGKQIKNNTITKAKLNLVASVDGKDPIIKSEYNARTINGYSLANNIVLNKTDIGLDLVDNIPDIDKSVSNPQLLLFNKKLSYGTQAQFQSWFDSNLDSFYLTEDQKAGLFVKDVNDTTTSADNAMTIIKDAKRFKRQYEGFVSLEWFGAKADGVDNNNGTWSGTDSTIAFQKALDFASDRGLALQLEEGVYIITDTLKPKKVNAAPDNKPKTYRLTILGKGRGTTRVQGTGNTLSGKNLIEFKFNTGDSTAWNDSSIKIQDMTLSAGKADRCLYMNKVIDVELCHMRFERGELACLEIGDNTGDNFAAYIHNNYFGGSTWNGGLNQGCMIIDSAYAEVYNNVSDGGKYALKCSLGQMYIAGNTFEGYKYAGIYGKSSGGGGSKIIGNTLRPYSGFDPNAVFNGEMHGIYIEAISGGVASNTIIGNQIFLPDPIELDTVALATVGSTAIASPHAGWTVTQAVSGATGLLVGITPDRTRVQLQKANGSVDFVINQPITQATTNAIVTPTSIVVNKGYPISLLGNAGYNILSNNRLAGGTYVIQSLSPGNIITGNSISGVRDGILVSADTQITNNFISLYAGSGVHVAIKRTAGSVLFKDNVYTGTLDGIAPQMFSNVTTTQRNNLGTVYPGLWLYDSTVNKPTYYDGTKWNYVAYDRFIGQSNGAIDGYTATNGGVYQYGIGSTNVPSAYGTLVNFNSGSPDGDGTNVLAWTNQLYFSTDLGVVHLQQRVYTYGAWALNQIWTSKQFGIIAASANTASVAAGSTPTKAEFDALLTELRDLKTKMRTSKILLT